MYLYKRTCTYFISETENVDELFNICQKLFFTFSSNTESLRLSFIQSISESVMFLLMSSDSNQGYLSSEVGLFVSSTDNSVHVVICGISVGCMGFSYANGVGLNVGRCHSVMEILVYWEMF